MQDIEGLVGVTAEMRGGLDDVIFVRKDMLPNGGRFSPS